MLFSSLTFIFVFLPIIFVLYNVVPNKCRNVLLLIFSLIFYAWGEPKYIYLMLFVIIINWLIGLLIGKSETLAYRKACLIVAVVIDLALLGYFKYTNFLTETYCEIFNRHFEYKEIVLPIGISFFIFQTISYIIDLYRKRYQPQKSLIDLALYVSFFPQLIAGPIVRYCDINEQIHQRSISSEKVLHGIRRFIYGLAKKTIIANVLAEGADQIFALQLSDITGVMAWAGAILYTLQIYYDFSGYSDMAIGLGKMFGFDFLENFNYPYLSKSISEFWRRWHISLGTWFKEYLYIPLGGNRRGKERTLLNLLIVFIATGIWHGASWNFVLWGCFYGIIIVFEKLGLESWLKNKGIIRNIYAILIVVIGWVLFRADGVHEAFGYIYRMFSPWAFATSNYSLFELIGNKTIIIAGIAILGCGIIQKYLIEIKQIMAMKNSNIEMIFCMLLFFISILQLASGTYNPFIYFRF